MHVAGLHAIGSLGAIRYLTSHIAQLFGEADADVSWSGIVRAEYIGLEIQAADLLSGPHAW